MKDIGKIFVAGHRGLVGSALVRALRRIGYENIVTVDRSVLDLREQLAVRDWFSRERPDCLMLAAGRVGGIAANASKPADFITDNLLLQTHVIDAANRYGCRKIVFFASSCMYPRVCEQPMKEEFLLTGPFEPTNAAFAVAKMAGLEMVKACARQYGIEATVVLPANLYGPGDNFDPDSGHVVSSMFRRMHEAMRADKPEFVVWGTGRPIREFLHVDDLAEAALFLAGCSSSPEVVNVGTGTAISIADLAELIRDVVGFSGRVVFDSTRPDGMPSKCLDSSRVRALGWHPTRPLLDGLRETYRWFLDLLMAPGRNQVP